MFCRTFVPYFHVVYTLPSELRDIAYQNKRVVYDLLMKAAAETTLTIAADPRRLGARIGVTAVLHSWGSALTQNPHSRYRVLFGAKSQGCSALTSCLKEHKFFRIVEPLDHQFRGGLTCLICYSLVGTRSRDTN